LSGDLTMRARVLKGGYSIALNPVRVRGPLEWWGCGCPGGSGVRGHRCGLGVCTAYATTSSTSPAARRPGSGTVEVPQAERLTGEWRLMGGAFTRRQVRPSTTTGWLPIRDVRCGPVVSGHRGHGRPGEVVVQHPSEPVVDGEADVDQCSIEAGDPSTVHLLVRTVAPMHPHNRGLVAVAV
jgi:hypothetical protein